MAYVDGFIIAVPNANKEAYRQMTEAFDPIFIKHGALKVVEAWADDVPDGVHTSFPMAVKLEPDESVVFSYIYWPDKATRDAGQAAFMADPAVADFDHTQNPFDGKRMIFGGFEVLSEF
jgi:uncharacterized protein YbaA (DUF1428 family)